MAFVGILSQVKLLLGPLVIQLVWYILKQLSCTAVSVKVVDIYLAALLLGKYPPLFTSTSMNNRPFFQNESKCETFHMKMSFACSFILMQIKVIFIRMVSHLDSARDD